MKKNLRAEGVRLLHGDSRDVLRTLPDASIDSVVTDPPYALVSITKRFGKPGSAPAKGDVYARASAGFMGKTWDTGETAFAAEFWAEVYRVLKPGGHVLAFGGTRTFHRLVCAIEDAGFEVRDTVAWLHGQGFPKSHDVSKGLTRSGEPDAACQWEGWGTALKPALEPITLARKPLIGTMAANVHAHGVGALNIDGCRVGMSDEDKAFIHKTARPNSAGQAHAGNVMNRPGSPTVNVHSAGRWPANVIHDGSDEVVAAFPHSTSGANPTRRGGMGYGGADGQEQCAAPRGAESGSAARFFYSAKASKADRGEGNTHPTVKPTTLMRYLCRLITPPGGTVLDPFMGSGSTGKAALLEGFAFVGIEREAEYLDIARKRIAAVDPLPLAA